MADDPAAQDPPAPPALSSAPHEESLRILIREEIAAALAEKDPEPTPAPKATTVREREAIAQSAAEAAVARVKAADPKPPTVDDKPSVVEPMKKTGFRAAANKFWGVVDEAVKP